jgi:hypothetical protein
MLYPAVRLDDLEPSQISQSLDRWTHRWTGEGERETENLMVETRTWASHVQVM